MLLESGAVKNLILLATTKLGEVWKIFVCPYVAFAESHDAIALLMEDLTPFLLPDVRQPLDEHREELILGTLARMHAQSGNHHFLRSHVLSPCVRMR